MRSTGTERMGTETSGFGEQVSVGTWWRSEGSTGEEVSAGKRVESEILRRPKIKSP
jgi:hypothetical protein